MGKRSSPSPALPAPEKLPAVRGALLGVLAARVAVRSAVEAFGFSAEEIAAEIGVPVQLVKDQMAECFMPEEVFLDRKSGRTLATFAGQAKIRLALEAQMAPAAKPAAPVKPAVKPAAKPAPHAKPRTKETLIVTRTWGPKRVLCNREESKLEVVCQLKDSTNLMPGMKLENAEAGEGGIWFYTGRLPRRRGRW